LAAFKYRQSLGHCDPTPSKILLNPVDSSIAVAIDSWKVDFHVRSTIGGQ